MKRKNLIYTILILFSSLCLTGYLFATEEEATTKNHKTVVIHEHEGVTPQILRIEPGTTVIWVNLTLVEAEVLFLDRKVIDAAECPVYFFIGDDGTYESHEMCAGCAASLCFQGKGRFDYAVKEARTSYGEEKEYRGTILVK